VSLSPHGRPSNAALAEALFALSEQEPEDERRLSLLKAGYSAFDNPEPAARKLSQQAPAWLRPIISQLVSCHGDGALQAAVQRLSTGGKVRQHSRREGYLARADLGKALESGPEELLPQRMRGAFHWHTTSSDGKASIETMARTCLRRGATWAVVADHSRGLEIASGLDSEGVSMQRRLVERWNLRHGEELMLIQGLETEVMEDGTLDIPQAERLDVDCVIAAIHSHLDPDRDQTERLLRAISTPEVQVLAHPRGRLFHYRSGIRAQWERVFAACAESGVALEINGFPRRQDLDPDLARLAGRAGCTFVLASDAHAPRHLDFDRYACAIAMLAGLGRESILNVKQAEDFYDWLAESG
jgi:histidinol phosphatase-like PHP family hydrolase